MIFFSGPDRRGLTGLQAALYAFRANISHAFDDKVHQFSGVTVAWE